MTSSDPDFPAAHQDDSLSVAVIGMAGRFPAAGDIDAFWRNLRDGVEGIREVDDEELARRGVDPSMLANPDYVKVVSMPDDIECFDAGFFSMTPREAEITDPQQRLLLQEAWHALEHAGYTPDACPGAVAVFSGAGANMYLIDRVLANPAVREGGGSMQLLIANQVDFLATRIAFHLNLRGPAMAVQTACSTSLTAIHMACQSLIAGECEMALAGGVAINTLGDRGYLYTENGIVSRDGHCRAFDAQSGGTVPGNGLGMVVLKPLARALADGDTIHAVIRGSAINNDGRDKMTYTAPSVSGQAAVIAEALSVAGVDSDTISYVETHGTGTALGDPIEIRALRRAFESTRSPDALVEQRCAIGAVKSNVGHLDAAAGVTGFIKTVLALRHAEIPPTLHFKKSNPLIGLQDTPFHVNTKLTPWPTDVLPRRAGVSSFGIGGTNVHVVLEEAPVPAERTANTSSQVLVLSARTPEALQAATVQLQEFFGMQPDVAMEDVAYVLQTGRKAFDFRHALVASTTEEALDELTRLRLAGPQPRCAAAPQVVFMFPGQGSQYLGMASDLYREWPVFRHELDQCAELLMGTLGVDLRQFLFALPEQVEAVAGLLNRIRYTHPALFAVEYALARQLMACGIVPTAMVGHSVGEYVAACIAGVFSLPDALSLVTRRAALMDECPAGGMLAVFASLEVIESLMERGLSIAAINSPGNITVSGSVKAIKQLAAKLQSMDLSFQTLLTSHAGHSSMLNPILDTFTQAWKGVALQAPAIPYVSNVTGTWVTAEEATRVGHWRSHLRNTVRFSDCVATLLKFSAPVLLEVGPGHSLCAIVRQNKEAGADADAAFAPTIATMANAKNAARSFEVTMLSLARVWQSGVALPWDAMRTQLHPGSQPRRIPLPTYPFAKERHWLGEARPVAVAGQSGAALPAVAPSRGPLPVNRALLGALFREPQTPVEIQLTQMCETLMGFSGVGADDDFFELGGHSLLATQLMARVRQVFEVDVPLRALFDGPTVAAIAEAIEQARAAGPATTPAEVDGDDGSAPLLATTATADMSTPAPVAPHDFISQTKTRLDNMSPEELLSMLAEKKRAKAALTSKDTSHE